VLEYPLFLVFPVAMAFAGAMDLFTMTIPNRVSAALVAGFLVAAPLAGLSLQDFAMHIGACLIVLSVGIGMFAAGWMGGGDAKLMAAASLWVGFDDLVLYLTQVSILGGALALAILAYRQMPAAALPMPGWALRLHEEGTGIPYGLAIAGAGLMIYPKTPWFAAFGF
jgi:prepilin peptidase CpaA